MKSELKLKLAELQSGQHLCAIAEEAAGTLATSAAFLKVGLDRGERASYIVADTSMADVVAALAATGIDVARERGRGALTLLTAHETYLHGGKFDPDAMIDRLRQMTEEALAAGFTGWRVVGEGDWVKAPGVDPNRLIEYEAKINMMLPGLKARALCVYTRARCPAEVLIATLRAHPVAIVGEHLCENPYYETPELVLTDTSATDRLNWMLRILERIYQAEYALRMNAERLQSFEQQLIRIQEDERRRVARELHDEIGQGLTAVKTSLQTLMRLGKVDAIPGLLSETLTTVDLAMEQVRSIAFDLRPAVLDDFGLAAALKWLVERTVRRTGLVVEYVVEPPKMGLPHDLETACYRVAQEALTNVVRHARATKVRLDMRLCEGELALRITDDGMGFDVTAAMERAAQGVSYGLLGMEERVRLAGGRLQIDSVANKGTTVHVCFPGLVGLQSAHQRPA